MTICLQFSLIFICFSQNNLHIDSLEASLQNSQETKDKINILEELCWNYRIENIEKGLIYGQAALALAQKNKDISKQAAILNKIGVLYRNKNELYQALFYYEQALKLAKIASSEQEEAYALNNIGQIYERFNQYITSEKHLRKAIILFEKLDNQRGLSFSLVNLAELYEKQNKLADATSLFEKVLLMRRNYSNQSEIITVLNSLGKLYLKQKQYAKSKTTYREAYQLSKQNGLSAPPYLTDVYLATNQLDSALYFAFLEFGGKPTLPDLNKTSFASKSIAQIFEKKADFEKAYLYEKAYTKYIEQYYQQDIAKQLASFENLQKQKTIELLEAEKLLQAKELYLRQNYIIIGTLLLVFLIVITLVLYRNNWLRKQQNEALQKQQEELKRHQEFKNHLFSILAHDLRNPVTAFQGLAYQLNYYQQEPQQIEQLSHEIDETTTALNDLLNNLLNWTLTQSKQIKPNPTTFQLQHLLTTIFSLYQAWAKQHNITLQNEIFTTITIHTDENILHLILRNLVANAIKFTPNGGIVTVNAAIEGNEVVISVKDTGIGIAADKLANLFALPQAHNDNGLRGVKGVGFGLNLCQEFTQILGGTIGVASEINQGTTFTLRFNNHSYHKNDL